MNDYFKPWWHKFGVLTLVMVLIFMSGCVRSQRVVDGISIPAGNELQYLVNSTPQGLFFGRRETVYAGTKRAFLDDEGRTFSYWYFITPQTIISCLLLVTKPQKTTPAKTRDLAAIEGA